jgi:uncharacterized protein
MKKFFILFCVLLSHVSWAQREVPPLWGHHVHDDAHILSPSTIDSLELMLTRHEDSTSNQIAIYTIHSLEGEVLEEFSLRVAHDEWKLGTAKNDNGVLLLIAVDDHKMRIEVGDGLEGVLTDARSNQIIRNEIAPHFRESEYDAGVMAGTKAIIASIAGEYAVSEETAENEVSWIVWLVIGIFVFSILGVFTAFALFISTWPGWILYLFLIPFYAGFSMIILGDTGGKVMLGAYILGLPIAKILVGRTAWGKRITKKMAGGKGSGGGWSSGSGWSGGSSGGGWSSGGGFSGGGGSFSGGGSSGSW